MWFVSNDKCTVLGRPGNKKTFCLTAFCTTLKLKIKISTTQLNLASSMKKSSSFSWKDFCLFFLNARSVKNTIYLSLKLQKSEACILIH